MKVNNKKPVKLFCTLHMVFMRYKHTLVEADLKGPSVYLLVPMVNTHPESNITQTGSEGKLTF